MVSTTKPLPPEIWDYIIDFLRKDIPSLQACSLVCKSFLPRSRYYRFERLKLQPRQASSFCKFLRGIPVVATFIRKLTIVPTRTSRPRPSMVVRKDLESLLPLARLLVYTTKLEIEGFFLNGELADIILDNFVMVKQLRLIRCSVASLDRLVILVHSFPQLTKLSMSDTYTRTVSDGNPDLHPTEDAQDLDLESFPRLCTVSFPSRVAVPYESIEVGFINWLSNHSLHTHIRTFKISDVSHVERHYVQRFIQQLGTSLQRLSIGSKEITLAANTGPILDFSKNTELKELTLWSLRLCRHDWAHFQCTYHEPRYPECFIETLPPDTTYPLEWVPKSLATLRPNRIIRLHFRFHAVGTCRRDWLALDWSELVDVLSEPNTSPKLGRIMYEFLTDESSKGIIIPFVASKVARLESTHDVQYVQRRSE